MRRFVLMTAILAAGAIGLVGCNTKGKKAIEEQASPSVVADPADEDPIAKAEVNPSDGGQRPQSVVNETTATPPPQAEAPDNPGQEPATTDNGDDDEVHGPESPHQDPDLGDEDE